MGLPGRELARRSPAPRLPGQVSSGGRAAPAGEGQRRDAPFARPAGGRARRGQRPGAGRGRRPRHLIKRLRVSREQRAHSAAGSCPRGGAAGRRARLFPGVGGVGRGGERTRRWPQQQPRRSLEAGPERRAVAATPGSPPRAPVHGGRGAALAALPVRWAPASARRRLQPGHPLGQCDPENGGAPEPLRLLAGYAPAAAARGQAAVSSPTLPAPTGAPARARGGASARRVPARSPTAAAAPHRLRRSRRPALWLPARRRACPPAARGRGPRGRPLWTAARLPGGAVPGLERVYFFPFLKQNAFRPPFPQGVFAGNPAGGSLC